MRKFLTAVVVVLALISFVGVSGADIIDTIIKKLDIPPAPPHPDGPIRG